MNRPADPQPYLNTPHLHRLVEDATADLHHLQVLFLLITSTLDVSHPAALILLAGVDEVAHRSVLIKHLEAARTTVSMLWHRKGSSKTERVDNMNHKPRDPIDWMDEWCEQLTSHIRLLFFSRSTCSGDKTLPVKGPISVPALIQVLEKMPRPSPGIELWAMITSLGSTRLDNFCTSAK